MLPRDIKRLPTFVDLFCGCGGLSLGFLKAGFRCLLAIDNNKQAVDCYNQNLKGENDYGATLEDLSRFRTRDDVLNFLHLHGMEPGSCDVLAGGPPCQSFSVVGRNKIRALMESGGDLKTYWAKKNQERTMLFEAYALFLEVLAPRWFLFENVPSIRSHETFPFILKRFQELYDDKVGLLDYEITHQNYLASDYGVPQNRRRFIMTGYREDLNIFHWDPPVKQPTLSVAIALDDLPSVPYGHRERDLPYDSIPHTPYQKAMRSGLPPASRHRIADHIGRWHNQDDLALFARMKPGARFADPEVQAAIVDINPEHKLRKYSADKFKDKLHKLDPNRPAWTVTAHLQKDCYKFIHHRQPRTITVREAARLQSIPDRFTFKDLSMIAAYRLIGNSVPPLLAHAFALSMLASDEKLASSLDHKSLASTT